MPNLTSTRCETNLVSGGKTGALAAALAAGAGKSCGAMALITNCLPAWGTMASSGTTKALGLTKKTALTRANIPGRNGPFCSPPALVRVRSNMLVAQPKLCGDGSATPRLAGADLASTGLEAGFAADAGAGAGDEAAVAEELAAGAAALEALAPAAATAAMGSPAVLSNTARTPMERPLGSIKGSTASTLALNKRPLKASNLTSIVCPGWTLA